VARKRGRLGKGGVPNLMSAAMTVVTDWRDGRIQGWMEAPKLKIATVSTGEGDGDGEGDRKEIVKEWAKEFELVDLFAGDEEEVMADVDAMQE